MCYRTLTLQHNISFALLQRTRQGSCKRLCINNVLPLKASRRDVIDKEKFFRTYKHQRVNFDHFIYIGYVVPPYSTRTIIIESAYRRWVKTPILLF